MLKSVPDIPGESVVHHYQPALTDRELTRFLVKDLSLGSQLALWSIRHWVQKRTRGHEGQVSLENTYRLAGTAEAAEIFDEFMTLLATSAMRPVRVECPCATNLSSDELLILRTLRSLQSGHVPAARLSMARVLHGKLSHAFCRLANAYVELMSKVNMSFDKLATISIAPPLKETNTCPL